MTRIFFRIYLLCHTDSYTGMEQHESEGLFLVNVPFNLNLLKRY